MNSLRIFLTALLVVASPEAFADPGYALTFLPDGFVALGQHGQPQGMSVGWFDVGVDAPDRHAVVYSGWPRAACSRAHAAPSPA